MILRLLEETKREPCERCGDAAHVSLTVHQIANAAPISFVFCALCLGHTLIAWRARGRTRPRAA